MSNRDDTASLSACILALVAASAAAILIPGQPFGLNMFFVTTVLAMAVLVGGGRDLDRTDLVLGAAAYLLMAQVVFRTASWVLALDVLGVLALACVGISGARAWREFVAVVGRLFTRLPFGLGLVATPAMTLARQVPTQRAAPVARGVAIGWVLLVIFGALFISADRAFASIAREAIFPDFDIGLIPARVFVGLVVAATAGALLLLKQEATTGADMWAPFGPEAKSWRRLDAIEWLPGIVLLDLLFAFFVAVQVTVLFGGNDHVLATEGLTYAEYARQGFFQLLAVVALTFGVIAAVVNLADLTSESMRRVAQWTLGVLCALTLVVLLSAYVRLDLYEQTYGFTRLRLLVHGAILWFAVVIVLVLIAGANWRAGWLPRAVLLVTAVGLLGFNLMNPDLFIARSNVERYERTGNIDPYYLGSLSLDAVPALIELDEPWRSCALAPMAFRTAQSPPPSTWAFNLSRYRSQADLRSLDLSFGPCP